MRIGVIGAGKIGLAFGSILENFFNVNYLDVFPPYDKGYNEINSNDINFICVNTAFDLEYDISNVISVVEKLNKNIPTLILSTCPPSFFDNEKILFPNLYYSPLFIRQGTIEEDIKNAEFILIGSYNGEVPELIIDFFNKILPSKEIFKTNYKESAIIKMALNGFLTLKISYANMIGDFCLNENINPHKVLDILSKNKAINPFYFKYGYGYGGPCLPIDNINLAKEISNPFPLEVDKENRKHLTFQINQFMKENDKNNIYVFDNLGYKQDVPIIKNSQKLEMLISLVNNGYSITIKDSIDVCNLIEEYAPNKFSFNYT